MTDMVEGVASSPVPTQPASSPVDVSQTSAPASERLFKQQEVNDIVGHAKHEAIERYKRSQDANRYQSNEQGMQDASRVNSPNVMSVDDYRRMAAEEAQRLMERNQEDAIRNSQEQEAKRIATEFLTKLDAGKSKYEDFDKVTADLDLQAIPNIVSLSNMVDNTADVMYELAKNPAKIANIQQLIAISPKMAFSEMRRLSESLKKNEEAANFKAPNSPLSQMKPSNTRPDSGGALSVSDYRKKYRV